MTNKDSVKNNKLISEFMKFENVGKSHYEVVLPHCTIIRPLFNMRFASSWDWLMPVVEKIEQSREDIYDIEEFLLIRDELASARINTTYKSVIDFIKWQNA